MSKYKTYVILNSGLFEVECICELKESEIKILEKLKKNQKIIESFCCGNLKCFFCKCEIVRIKDLKLTENNSQLINEKIIVELFTILQHFHRN